MVTVNELLDEGHERDCDAHVWPLNVRFTMTPHGFYSHEDHVAAVIRTIAQCTDGLCATKNADTIFITTTGIVLHFHSDAKRTEFRERMKVFLHRELMALITISDVRPSRPASTVRG